MRISLGLVLSILFHATLLVYALYWAGSQDVRVNMDRPVYTVDLISLAPPPPAGPAPVVEVAPESVAESQVPVVEATPEPVVEVKPTPVVEAKAEPKVEKISPKKVEKETVVRKKEKPKPKPKPKKTTKQLLAEGLAAAKAKSKKQEQKKNKALQDELAALKKKDGGQVYSHGGQTGGVEGGKEGGVVGGSGSGLSEVYAEIVGLIIKKNWRYPSFAGDENLIVTVEIVVDKDGKIISSKIFESSGNPDLDNSTLRAVRETEYVTQPSTKRDHVLRINFNSQDLTE